MRLSWWCCEGRTGGGRSCVGLVVQAEEERIKEEVQKKREAQDKEREREREERQKVRVGHPAWLCLSRSLIFEWLLTTCIGMKTTRLAAFRWPWAPLACWPLVLPSRLSAGCLCRGCMHLRG